MGQIKKRIIVTGAIASLAVILFAIVSTLVDKNKLKDFDVSISCFGVVQETKVDKTDRMTPYFLIDDEWSYLGSFGYSLINIVQAGDSIAKTSGENTLTLYRRDRSNKYSELKQVQMWN
mgnify:CR=1 FL=1